MPLSIFLGLSCSVCFTCTHTVLCHWVVLPNWISVGCRFACMCILLGFALLACDVFLVVPASASDSHAISVLPVSADRWQYTSSSCQFRLTAKLIWSFLGFRSVWTTVFCVIRNIFQIDVVRVATAFQYYLSFCVVRESFPEIVSYGSQLDLFQIWRLVGQIS